ERGAMRVGISSHEPSADTLLERVLLSPPMVGSDLTGDVTTRQPYAVPALGGRRFTVAAVDLGIKAMTPRLMAERGIETHVVPVTSTIADIVALQPDGLFLSNGPGDPAMADHAVDVVREALNRGLPVFGICFGNQVLGRALGVGASKLRNG